MKKIILFVSIILMVSCQQKKAAKTETSTVQPIAPPAPLPGATAIDKTLEVKVEAGAMMNETGNPYSVDSITIQGDILSLFVNYTGGCKTHEWELVSNGMYAKSLPPQIGVCLKHNSNGDACRELISKELKFNITKLKYHDKNTVVVKLNDKMVRYISK